MRRWVVSLTIASILAFSATAMAEEKHPESSSLHDEHAVQSTSEKQEGFSGHSEMPNMTIEDHQNMPSSHTEEMMPDMSPEEHQNMQSGHTSEGHSEGHGAGPIIETPPNYKVLGAFGAINAAFGLMGIWNKWLKRKETKACQA